MELIISSVWNRSEDGEKLRFFRYYLFHRLLLVVCFYLNKSVSNQANNFLISRIIKH